MPPASAGRTITSEAPPGSPEEDSMYAAGFNQVHRATQQARTGRQGRRRPTTRRIWRRRR